MQQKTFCIFDYLLYFFVLTPSHWTAIPPEMLVFIPDVSLHILQ